MSEKIYFTYVTCENTVEAEKIALHLLEHRLVACANILPQMKSLYHWKEQIEVGNEAVLILKSIERNLPEIERQVRELHSYSVPCILSFAIDHGNSDYQTWLIENIKST